MKTKGLVLEVQRNTVTVLTPDGQFRKLPKRGKVELGEEYSYGTSNRSFLAAASLALLVMSSLLVSSLYQPAPSASPEPTGIKPDKQDSIIASNDSFQKEQNEVLAETADPIEAESEETTETQPAQDHTNTPDGNQGNTEPPAQNPPSDPADNNQAPPPAGDEEPADPETTDNEPAGEDPENSEETSTSEEEEPEEPEEPIIIVTERNFMERFWDWFKNEQ